MSYQVIFHQGALRETKKLPKTLQNKIVQIATRLTKDPRPKGYTKLTGLDAYRVRIGDYRMAYAIEDDLLVVLIVKVAHRKDIYKEIDVIRQRLGQ